MVQVIDGIISNPDDNTEVNFAGSRTLTLAPRVALAVTVLASE